jgi:hypothetical protein
LFLEISVYHYTIGKVFRVKTTFEIIPGATGGFPVSVELVVELRYTEANLPRSTEISTLKPKYIDEYTRTDIYMYAGLSYIEYVLIIR